MSRIRAVFPAALVLFLVLATWATLKVLQGRSAVPAVQATTDAVSTRSLPSSVDSAASSIAVQRELERTPQASVSISNDPGRAAQNAEERSVVQCSIVFGLGSEVANGEGEVVVAISTEPSTEQVARVSSGEFQIRARHGDRVVPLSVLIDGQVAVVDEEPLVVQQDRILRVRCNMAKNVELIVVDRESGAQRDSLTVWRSNSLTELAPWSSACPTGASMLIENGRSPLVLVPKSFAPPRSAIERLMVRAPGTAWAIVDVDWRAGGSRRIEIAEASAQLEVELFGRLPGLQRTQRSEPPDRLSGDSTEDLFVRVREQSGPWETPASVAEADPIEGADGYSANLEDEVQVRPVPLSRSEDRGKVEEARALGSIGCVRSQIAFQVGRVAVFDALEPGRYLVTLERGDRESPVEILGLEPVNLVSGSATRIAVAIEAPQCSAEDASHGDVPGGELAVAERVISVPIALQVAIVDASSGAPLRLPFPPRISRTDHAAGEVPAFVDLRWNGVMSAWTEQVLPGTFEIHLEEDALEEWASDASLHLVVDVDHRDFTLPFERVPVAAISLVVNGERVQWPEDSALQLRLCNSESTELAPSREVDGTVQFKLPHSGPWNVVVPELAGYRRTDPVPCIEQERGVQEWIVQATVD